MISLSVADLNLGVEQKERAEAVRGGDKARERLSLWISCRCRRRYLDESPLYLATYRCYS